MDIQVRVDNLKTFFNKGDMALTLFCVGLLFLVGWVDFITGFEFQFFVFYVLPIWLATWKGSSRLGYLFVVLSTVSWFGVDSYAMHPYSSPFIPIWNGLIRSVVFFYIVYSVDNIKTRLMLEEIHADYDVLTGILNGRGFRDRLETLFPLIRREQKTCTLAFIDVDNFKQVNDTLGHAVGDRVLKAVAEVMKTGVRSSDLVSRLGGDEFVVFLPDTQEAQAKIVLEKLKAKLQTTVQEAGWPIGFSIGSYTFNSGQTDLTDALSNADALMYQVKREGKNKISFKSFDNP